MYGLEQLLEDAGRRRPTAGHGIQPAMTEVFNVLDRYISACLEQGRGLVLHNFGRFGLQATKLRGKSVQRPYFHLAEAFCRAHNLPSARHLPPSSDGGSPCTIEDFNFSKAAIRFSKKLTKDHVSTGLRDLVQQLGEAIGQGRMVSLDFSFGRLTSRDREAKFEFSLKQGLGEEPPAEADAESRPATPATPAISRGAGRQTMRPSPVAPESPKQSPVPGRGSFRGIAGTGLKQPKADIMIISGTIPEDDVDIRPESPRPFRRAEAVGRNFATCSDVRPQTAPSLPVKEAYDHALHRHITDLEHRASEAMRDQAESEGELRKSMQEAMKAEELRRARRRVQDGLLQHQIQAKERRRREDAEEERWSEAAQPVLVPKEAKALKALHRRDQITSQAKEECAEELASAVGLARSQGLSTSLKGVKKIDPRVSSEIRELLDKQIEAKVARKDALKKTERALEASVIQTEVGLSTLREQQLQVAKLQEKAQLAAAWKEGSKLQGLRRTIEAIERGTRWPPMHAEVAITGACVSSLTSGVTARPETLPPAGTRFLTAR